LWKNSKYALILQPTRLAVPCAFFCHYSPLRCLCFFPCSCHSMLIIRTCYWPDFFFPFSCKDKLISRYICSFGFWLQAQFATSIISSRKYLCHLDENTFQHKKVSDCWRHPKTQKH